MTGKEREIWEIERDEREEIINSLYWHIKHMKDELVYIINNLETEGYDSKIIDIKIRIEQIERTSSVLKHIEAPADVTMMEEVM